MTFHPPAPPDALAHTTAPPDAIHVGDWLYIDDCDWRRMFVSAADRVITGSEGERITVSVNGEQVQTGDVLRRYGYVSGECSFTAAQLRQFAAACLNAADDLERLSR